MDNQSVNAASFQKDLQRVPVDGHRQGAIGLDH
jgi:hypothetical protein